MIGAEKPVLEGIHAMGAGCHIGQIRCELPHPGFRTARLPGQAGGRVLKQNDAPPHSDQRQKFAHELLQFPRDSELTELLRQKLRSPDRTWTTRFEADQRKGAARCGGQSKSNNP